MTDVLFIVNPTSGGGGCLKKFSALQPMLDARSARHAVVYSEGPGHATELARRAVAGGCGTVVAAGGDGTVREVAAALVHTDAALGILPLGSGNDLARALGIPADPARALELILSGEARSVDAATANGELFFNVSGLGFDVDVLEKTELYKNRFRGSIAYLLGILHALVAIKSYRITLTSAEMSYTGDALMVAAGNGMYFGGGLMVAPKASMDDGLLDVCVVKKVNRLKVLRCLAKFRKGRHLELDIVRYFKTASLTVACEPEAVVQLDGERIGRTPVEFRALPKALRVIADIQGSAPNPASF